MHFQKVLRKLSLLLNLSKSDVNNNSIVFLENIEHKNNFFNSSKFSLNFIASYSFNKRSVINFEPFMILFSRESSLSS